MTLMVFLRPVAVAATILFISGNFQQAAAQAATLERRVTASSDDAEQRPSGRVNLSSSDLELADQTGSNPAPTVGMRFAGVGIPRGATIIDAYVQFQVDETNSDPVSLTIRGQATDDALAFTNTTADITSRPATVAFVDWSPVSWTTVGAAGPDQRTPDLSAVVQEIVNRADWSAGNAMVIIVNGTGTGKRTAESYNGSASGVPLLHVEYIASSGGQLAGAN